MSDLFADKSGDTPKPASAAPGALSPEAQRDQDMARDRTHRCRICGDFGAFGFGLSRRGKTRWACGTHKDEVERMAG